MAYTPLPVATVPYGDRELPFIYDLTGRPTDVLTGARLHKDRPVRTLACHTAATAQGLRCIVRTLFLVYDDHTAVLDPLPGPPRLWGTSIQIGKAFPRAVAEYTTAEKARAGHERVLSAVRKGWLPFAHEPRASA